MIVDTLGDTKLYREIIDPDDCQEIQEDLNTLSAWSKIWLLRFNETKCMDTIHLETLPRIPAFLSFNFNLLCGTVSNALGKSK
jgi:hypothetical protein